MKIRLINLSGTAQISTQLGVLAPNQSTITDVDSYELYSIELERLVAAGVLDVTVLADSVASTRDTLIINPLTLYVDANGADTNPGTLTLPLRTIQAAIDLLSGKTIRTTVVINVGAGSFPGFAIEGLQIDSFGRGTVTPTLTIQGTFGTAAITTGLTSSTVTSGSTSVGLTTLTDTSQALTVNELTGKWILISGAYRVIVENTATTISYLGGSAPTGGTAYTLHSPATIIDQSLGTVGSTGTGARSLTMALPVSNSSTTSVVINTVAFRQETSGTGTTMTSLGGNGIYRFQNCSFVATTALTNYRVLNATGMYRALGLLCRRS